MEIHEVIVIGAIVVFLILWLPSRSPRRRGPSGGADTTWFIFTSSDDHHHGHGCDSGDDGGSCDD